MLKTKNLRQCSDLHLAYLNKNRKKNQNELRSLDWLLQKNKIFFDKKLIDSTIDLLLKKGLIQEVFPKRKVLYGIGKTRELSKAIKEKNILGVVLLFSITNKGKHFIQSGQLLAKEDREKNSIRKRNIILVGSAIISMISFFISNWNSIIQVLQLLLDFLQGLVN